jgi:membrane associated rhomboid family serine protease
VLAFILVWFGVNILFGFVSLGGSGLTQAVAWQAHIGGFVAGFFGFGLFDPVPPSAAVNGQGPDPTSTVH